MPVRPEFAEMVQNFVKEYGHHYTPVADKMPLTAVPIERAGNGDAVMAGEPDQDTFGALLDHFFNEYGHHFTPSEVPHKVDAKAYIEAERLRRGMENRVPQGINGDTTMADLERKAQQRYVSPNYQPPKDNTPSALDYFAAIPGTAVAAYNNNMPRIFGDRATMGNLLGDATGGRAVDSLGDSFNRVLDHTVPDGARQSFNTAVDAVGHGMAAMPQSASMGAPQAAWKLRQATTETPPVKSLGLLERERQSNLDQMAARNEWLQAAKRGRGLAAEVEIQTPERTPAPPPPPAMTQSSSTQPQPTTAPQSSATSANISAPRPAQSSPSSPAP